jgi:hypothetical protein
MHGEDIQSFESRVTAAKVAARDARAPLFLVVSGVGALGDCASGLSLLFGATLFVLAALLYGCSNDAASEHCADYPRCAANGAVIMVNMCCPVGAVCNYGMGPARKCSDGTCVEFQSCPGEMPERPTDTGADAGS